MTLTWVDYPGPDRITRVLQSTEPFPAEDGVEGDVTKKEGSKSGNAGAFGAGGGRPRAKIYRHFQRQERLGLHSSPEWNTALPAPCFSPTETCV